MSTVNFNPYQSTYDASSTRASNPMSQITNAVAQLLGVSTGSLSASLSSGKTFAQIANADGVSTDSLVSTIANAMATDAPSGAPTLTSDQLNTIATDIANGTHHHPGQQNPTSTTSPTATAVTGANTASTVDDLAALLGLSNDSVATGLTNGASLTDLISQSGSQSTASTGGLDPMSQVNMAVAKLLGIGTDSLSASLSSGKTLAQIATSQGVSTDSLVSTIADAMAANAPAGAPALSTDQLKVIATDIANGTPPSPPNATGGSAGTTASTAAQQLTDIKTLDELAQVLGISSSTLASGLANNTSLSALLTQSTGLQLDSYL